MIIDVHTHTFPNKIAARAVEQLQRNSHTAAFSDGTDAGLIADEKRAGVDWAIVQPVATNPEKVAHMNDTVFELNRTAKERGVYSFAAMHPAFTGWEAELERIKKAGTAGIKLHPPYESIAIDDPRTFAILKKCKELDLIVLIHSGRDVGLPGATEALPEKIRRALDAVGPMKLIAAHMGGWGCWEDVPRFLADTGVFLDTAFSLGSMTPAPGDDHWKQEELNLLDADAFCQLVRAFGAERILFGTDSPWADPTEEIAKICRLPLTETEKESILGKNAETLLRSALYT